MRERERYPTRTRRPRDRASDTTRADSNARIFPSRDFKLVSMVSSPGLVRPGRRARARDFISPHSPAGAQRWKRKYYPQRDDKARNQSKKNEKKSFATSLTYRHGDSLRLRFSAHRRDGDASVRDLGDRGHVFNVRVFYFECGI